MGISCYFLQGNCEVQGELNEMFSTVFFLFSRNNVSGMLLTFALYAVGVLSCYIVRFAQIAAGIISSSHGTHFDLFS